MDNFLKDLLEGLDCELSNNLVINLIKSLYEFNGVVYKSGHISNTVEHSRTNHYNLYEFNGFIISTFGNKTYYCLKNKIEG